MVQKLNFLKTYLTENSLLITYFMKKYYYYRMLHWKMQGGCVSRFRMMMGIMSQVATGRMQPRANELHLHVLIKPHLIIVPRQMRQGRVLFSRSFAFIFFQGVILFLLFTVGLFMAIQ